MIFRVWPLGAEGVPCVGNQIADIIPFYTHSSVCSSRHYPGYTYRTLRPQLSSSVSSLHSVPIIFHLHFACGWELKVSFCPEFIHPFTHPINTYIVLAYKKSFYVVNVCSTFYVIIRKRFFTEFKLGQENIQGLRNIIITCINENSIAIFQLLNLGTFT